MKIKGSLIGALALTAVLGISGLGVANADDSSNIETTPPAVEYNENNNYEKSDNNTYQYEYRRGCSNQQSGQYGKGKYRGEGGQMRNSYFMQSVEELAQSGILSEQDVVNIQEYHISNRGQHHNRMNDQSCTRVDEMVSKNIITEEQGQNLKETLEKNLNK